MYHPVHVSWQYSVDFLPNAGRQAPPIAGATQEQRLLAVACTP